MLRERDGRMARLAAFEVRGPPDWPLLGPGLPFWQLPPGNSHAPFRQ